MKREAAERPHLSADDLRELVPSGKKTRHNDSTYWAITYLFQAAPVERPGRGLVRITPRGKDALTAGRAITLATLERFPEFKDFKERKRATGEPISQTGLDAATEHVSPVEAITDMVDSVNDAVARDLLAPVIAQPPEFLERLVLQFLRELGYGGLETTATQHLGGPGDEGLDGVIRRDALGLDVVYVQAKRYAPERRIGRPDIQAFVGALSGAQASRGVFITTSSFSREARKYADRVGMRLLSARVASSPYIMESWIEAGVSSGWTQRG